MKKFYVYLFVSMFLFLIVNNNVMAASEPYIMIDYTYVLSSDSTQGVAVLHNYFSTGDYYMVVKSYGGQVLWRNERSCLVAGDITNVIFPLTSASYKIEIYCYQIKPFETEETIVQTDSHII